MSTKEKKERFRNFCKKKIFRPKQRYFRQKKLAKIIEQRLLCEDVEDAMLYIPMRHEVDVMPIIKALRRSKKRVWVPYMEENSFKLVPFRLPLKRKRYGIMEPKQSRMFRKQKIDVALIPILGVDRRFKRIGFGKGMYDRFFEKHKKNIKKRIFVAPVLCIGKEALGEAHDIDAEEIIGWRE